MTAATNRQHSPVAPPTPVRIIRAHRITTLDGEADTRVLATVGERIAAVGEAAEAYTALPGAETVDLGDVHLVPGFHDAHCHPMEVANAALRVDLGAGAGTPGSGSRREWPPPSRADGSSPRATTPPQTPTAASTAPRSTRSPPDTRSW